MEEVNLSFLLYIEDDRELFEVKQLIEDALKISLHPEVAESRREGPAFECETLGLYVTLRGAASSTRSSWYRFAGATMSRYYAEDGARTSISSHIARALEAASLSRVLSREEFAKLDGGSAS